MSKYCATTIYEPPTSSPKKPRFLSKKRRKDEREWEAENVRNLRRPHNYSGANASAQQPPTHAAEQEEIELSVLDFNPYGWASIWWIVGVWIDYNHYHYLPYYAVATALIGIVFKRGPHYLFTSAVILAIGWVLLKKALLL